MSEDEQPAEYTYPWPAEQTIPYSFAVVDAALWEFLIEHPLLEFFTARRQALTTGSAHYKVQIAERKKDGDVAIIYARMISERITHLRLMPGPLMNKEGRDQEGIFWDIWHSLFYKIASEIRQQKKAIEEGIIKQGTLESRINRPIEYRIVDPDLLASLLNKRPETTPRIGRPSTEINEWARQQVKDGQPRSSVFLEYLQRRGIDADDENEVAKAKEAFRKTLTRTKRT